MPKDNMSRSKHAQFDGRKAYVPQDEGLSFVGREEAHNHPLAFI